MINSIGLPNRGLEGFLEHDLPELARLPVPLVVSVMGFSRDEVAELVKAVSARDEVSLIELNISCPNVETGLVMGADPDETAALLELVAPLSRLPLIVKLSPNASEPEKVAEAAERSGAGAISLINTLKGMALDPASGEPWLGGGSGGLSGPAIRAVALQQVAAVCDAVSVPVIGMGGIQTAAHAAEFLRVGARCVAIGTESFRDPAAGAVVSRKLRDERALC
jgi:dihydroorotate dehydrogenase (NAD+) catalytic subunit